MVDNQTRYGIDRVVTTARSQMVTLCDRAVAHVVAHAAPLLPEHHNPTHNREISLLINSSMNVLRRVALLDIALPF